MAETTHFINYIAEELTYPAAELSPAVITGHPQLDYRAVLAIDNAPGSNVKLKIKQVAIRSLTSQASALPTTFNVNRITAMSGGVAVGITPLDTNNTLPSQITAGREPIVTTAANYRKAVNKGVSSMTAALTGFGASGVGHARAGNNRAEVYWNGPDGQPITLNEGQGVSIEPAQIPLTCAYHISLLISLGGVMPPDQTFFIMETVRAVGVMPVLALFNGAGSGKTVRVRQIDIQEAADNALPIFTLERIDGVLNGTTLNPVAMDTGAAALPAGVTVKRDAYCLMAGHKIGAVVMSPYVRRSIQQVYGTGPSFAGVDMTGLNHMAKTVDNYNADIAVREGQGIAIFNRNASGWGKYEFYVEFNREDLGGAPTGGLAFVPFEGG